MTETTGTVADTAQQPAAAATQTVNSAADTAQDAAKQPVEAATQSVDTAGKVAETSAGRANQALAPIADTPQKTVDTATQTAAPVVAHVANTAASASSSVETVAEVVAPAVGALSPVVDNTLHGLETTLTVAGLDVNTPALTASAARGLLDATDASRGGTQSDATFVPDNGATASPASPNGGSGAGVTSAAVSTAPAPTVPPPTPRNLRTPRDARSGVSSTLPSAPVGDLRVTQHGGVAMPSSHSHAPLPDIPSGPLTALLSASASAGGGALVILLAALAAALSLAAPGLGRRLRPTLAPWPQPTLHLSLERPG